MAASLNNPPLLKYHDTVAVHDGGQAVGNHKGGPSAHQLIHPFLDDLFGTGIDGAGGFI